MLELLVLERKPTAATLRPMSVHDQIKRRREALGWSMERLAQEVASREGSDRSLAWQTIQQWENGTSAPRRSRLQTVAAIFRCTVSDLLETSIVSLDNPVAVRGLVRLPVVGELRASEDGQVTEVKYPVGAGGVVEYPTTDPNAEAWRIRSDEWHPRYRSGEYLVVEPGVEPQEGDDVMVVCTNGKQLLKHFNWRRDGEVQLLPFNPTRPPLTLVESEIVSMTLVSGRVRRAAVIRGD